MDRGGGGYRGTGSVRIKGWEKDGRGLEGFTKCMVFLRRGGGEGVEGDRGGEV